jgi:hypothetical protein
MDSNWTCCKCDHDVTVKVEAAFRERDGTYRLFTLD